MGFRNWFLKWCDCSDLCLKRLLGELLYGVLLFCVFLKMWFVFFEGGYIGVV